MSEETETSEGKSGIKLAQVVASALAAVTAAFLGSTLGVAGTVAGAGIASVVTTVGSELYLRSLRRTREAALRTKEAALVRVKDTRVLPSPDVAQTDEPTVFIPRPGAEQPPSEEKKRWKARWPLIVGTSVAAFVIGMLAITGFEGITGQAVSGGSGTTLGKFVGGSSGSSGGTTTETPTTTQAPARSTTEAPASRTKSSSAPTTASNSESATPSTTSSPSSSATATPTASATPTTGVGG